MEISKIERQFLHDFVKRKEIHGNADLHKYEHADNELKSFILTDINIRDYILHLICNPNYFDIEKAEQKNPNETRYTVVAKNEAIPLWIYSDQNIKYDEEPIYYYTNRLKLLCNKDKWHVYPTGCDDKIKVPDHVICIIGCSRKKYRVDTTHKKHKNNIMDIKEIEIAKHLSGLLEIEKNSFYNNNNIFILTINLLLKLNCNYYNNWY